MRIGQLARRAGVTTKTVRYYESLGLITPERLPNGYRDYSEHDVRLVREARALSELGLRVEQTRPFLECLASGREHADDCPAALAGYREAITDLNARIEALTARRDLLVHHLRQAAYRGSAVSDPSDERIVMHDWTRIPTDLPVPQDDGAADHLPGLAVPSLRLPSTAGDVIDLAELGRTGRSILYCYPLTGRPDTDLPEGWDAIPGARGCTPEACGFRDHHGELRAAGVNSVFGLSSQDTDYQREVVDRLNLPFAMLSDTGFRLADALDLPTFHAGGSRLYKRLTLVIHDGRIEHVFYPIFPPDQHAQQVLRWLHADPVG
ncbi:MerR family transcriptional regulator [Actinoallomurus sp. CA-150999]|uniref:MerR family transcriptional regulator n=1 Tax=Actinoallomurus sp. CA-150999 TaxID=3239887 RepID=UPI003D91F895